MEILAQIIVWLNAVANALGGLLLVPIERLPGWLSATIVAAVTGILLLLVFKYTSNQRAIKRVRADIKANMLALKLFKESASVALRAQERILRGAFWLLVYAVVPILVMLVPVLLILGQVALWYQARPLRIGEEAIVTLKLGGGAETAWPKVSMQPTDAVDVDLGPVRIRDKREICWNIKARANGYHRLAFQVGERTYEKELAIGDGIMRVSQQRPARQWSEVLLHPSEEPFDHDSPVQSIEIAYPERASWTSGTDYWVFYWFAVSMVSALIFRRPLNVNI
jgi:uncharacterized membrane protein (DUF106 family)